ncbi:MAG: carbohydrate ABC transporter permease [Clostridia bacterium]|nr:carbohydrate ABC transporter permease [Clostridia bacterium]
MKRIDAKQTGMLARTDLKTAYGKTIYGIFLLILSVTALIAVVPAIWTILTAFKETQEIYAAFSFFPKNITWDKAVIRLVESWNSLQLGKSFVNTLVLSVGNLGFHVIVCGFGGYVLSKLKPRGTKLLFTLVVWTMMMPSQIRMVPNYISWLHFPFASDIGYGFNLLDTFWPMWLGAGADTFAVLLFKNAFDSLSNSYVEAAKLDGCTNYGVFFKIMLPLAMPVIIFQSINILSAAWSDFFTPLLVLDELTVVPLSVYRLKEDTSIQMNTYFMALVFASIPPFIIFAIFQKRILGGVNIGGVKG